MELKDFDFRIWDKTKEKFLKKEPTLIKLDNERVIAGRISRFYANTADIEDMFIGNGNDLEIELWTGLYDKNGKKIYEGDIISFYDIVHDTNRIGVIIKRHNGEFRLEFSKNDTLGLRILDESEFLIIGNIHENKNLLEEINE